MCLVQNVKNNDFPLFLLNMSLVSPQLEAYYAGEDPASVADEFGNHSLYKNLGYFSLIGLLRLHTQLGDYHQALQAVSNVQLSKKVGGGWSVE